MKQFIFVALCIFGSALAGPPPPECMKMPEGKSQKECCQIPELVPDAIVQKCKAANPMPPPTPGSPPKGCCVSECIMNETKILVGGKLDKAAAVKYMTETLKDPEAVKAATAAIDYCEKEANSKKAEFDEAASKAAPGEKVCNMISGFTIGCVNGQIYKNCPPSKFGADASCSMMKSYVDRCGFLCPFKVGA